ncbi:hypothetical protein GP486_006244 [Trichoglossum hirsutum]|uniref:Uncharacterized protein n=1 Tax=Trichoglossum hirsutum TaxID=265104 RepID=A0A9P8IE12_9PEZI|nr:hypothetical protein GP486_006244 [Trichoglossum hirsutum]
MQLSDSLPADHLDIPGLRDTAVCCSGGSIREHERQGTGALSRHRRFLQAPAAPPGTGCSTRHRRHSILATLFENTASGSKSRVGDKMLKDEFQNTCDAILMDGLDLELVHEDQDTEYLVRHGVKRGTARRFMRDIGPWAKRYKLDTEDFGSVA